MRVSKRVMHGEDTQTDRCPIASLTMSRSTPAWSTQPILAVRRRWMSGIFVSSPIWTLPRCDFSERYPRASRLGCVFGWLAAC